MSSASFTLTLDTVAPAITWGSALWNPDSNLLRIPAEVNEPSFVSAELSIGTRRWAMFTDGEYLFANDVDVDNWVQATIDALVRDDVGNEAVRSYTLWREARPGEQKVTVYDSLLLESPRSDDVHPMSKAQPFRFAPPNHRYSR